MKAGDHAVIRCQKNQSSFWSKHDGKRVKIICVNGELVDIEMSESGRKHNHCISLAFLRESMTMSELCSLIIQTAADAANEPTYVFRIVIEQDQGPGYTWVVALRRLNLVVGRISSGRTLKKALGNLLKTLGNQKPPKLQKRDLRKEVILALAQEHNTTTDNVSFSLTFIPHKDWQVAACEDSFRVSLAAYAGDVRVYAILGDTDTEVMQSLLDKIRSKIAAK